MKGIQLCYGFIDTPFYGNSHQSDVGLASSYFGEEINCELWTAAFCCYVYLIFGVIL